MLMAWVAPVGFIDPFSPSNIHSLNDVFSHNPSLHHSYRTNKKHGLSLRRRGKKKRSKFSFSFTIRWCVPGSADRALFPVSVGAHFPHDFLANGQTGAPPSPPSKIGVTLWNRQGGLPPTEARSLPAAGLLTGISKHTWHEVTGKKAKGFYVIFYYRFECSVCSLRALARHVTAMKVLIDEITCREKGDGEFFE